MNRSIEPRVQLQAQTSKPAILRTAVNLAVFVLVAAFAVHILLGQLQHISPERFLAAAEALPKWRIAASAALTLTSFCALASYDVIATRLVAPGRVPTLVAAFAGAAGTAVSNTLGFHVLTGSAARYRIYRPWGLDMADIARVISLSWAPLGLGFMAALAVALVIEPPRAAGVHSDLFQIAGLFLLAILAILLVWLARTRRTVGYGRFSLTFPAAPIIALEMAIAAIETAATIGALYILIPQTIAPPFTIFAVAFIGSVLLGIVSHAPGGVGVFEAAMIALFPTGHVELFAALMLFRLIYNLAPFGIAVFGLGLFEMLKPVQINSKADSAG
ncbi:MAG TPA: hypothetical protein VII49_09080 [Rhizomicrobium sp.]